MKKKQIPHHRPTEVKRFVGAIGSAVKISHILNNNQVPIAIKNMCNSCLYKWLVRSQPSLKLATWPDTFVLVLITLMHLF